MPQKKEISKQAIVETYTNTDRSQDEAARALGISRTCFTRLLKEHGIESKGRGRSLSANPNARSPKSLDNRDWLASELSRKTTSQIARELCVPRATVAYRVKLFGLCYADRKTAARESHRKAFPNGRYGELASNWHGGRRLFSRGVSGYIAIYSPNHPCATKEGYVMEHRLVMEKVLGRHLTEEEVVHHKNGDKSDNRPENLELHTKSSHMREHLTLTGRVETLEKKLKRYEDLYGDLEDE